MFLVAGPLREISRLPSCMDQPGGGLRVRLPLVGMLLMSAVTRRTVSRARRIRSAPCTSYFLLPVPELRQNPGGSLSERIKIIVQETAQKGTFMRGQISRNARDGLRGRLREASCSTQHRQVMPASVLPLADQVRPVRPSPLQQCRPWSHRGCPSAGPDRPSYPWRSGAPSRR
jgi:hypothetical protein